MKPIQATKAAPCITGALLFGFGFAGSALAEGFSLSGFVSESLDYTENAGLDAVSAGATLTSSTSFGLDLRSETAVSTFGLSASSFLYVARNPDGSISNELGYPSLSLSYSDAAPTRQFAFGASYRISPAGDGTTFVVDDVNDDGVIDPGEVTVLLTEAKQLTFSLNASYSTDLTSTDSLRVSARASFVDFDGTDPDLFPSQRQSLKVTWNHQFSDDLSGGASLSGAWFSNEAPIPVSSNATSLTANLGYEVNNLMSVSANLGVSKVDREEGATVSSTNSLNGGASLDYALADGAIGVGLSFGVRPSDGGILRQTVSLGVDYSRAINAAASLSVAVDLTTSGDIGDALGSGSRSLTISPSYNHQLTDDVSANLGYRYRNVSGSPGATSHGVYLGLSKSFQFLQ